MSCVDLNIFYSDEMDKICLNQHSSRAVLMANPLFTCVMLHQTYSGRTCKRPDHFPCAFQLCGQTHDVSAQMHALGTLDCSERKLEQGKLRILGRGNNVAIVHEWQTTGTAKTKNALFPSLHSYIHIHRVDAQISEINFSEVIYRSVNMYETILYIMQLN